MHMSDREMDVLGQCRKYWFTITLVLRSQLLVGELIDCMANYSYMVKLCISSGQSGGWFPPFTILNRLAKIQ